MDEARAREAIVRYGQRLWDRRLVTGTSGNISVLLDDGDIVATPSARSLGSLESRELVRVDPNGAARDPAQRPTSELPLHLAAYRERPHVRCVVHTHPTFCVVWSRTGSVFPRDTVGARESLGSLAWTPFRPNGSSELAELCALEFARGIDTVIMERHGLSSIAEHLEDAFMQTDLAEEAARIAYFSKVAGFLA